LPLWFRTIYGCLNKLAPLVVLPPFFSFWARLRPQVREHLPHYQGALFTLFVQWHFYSDPFPEVLVVFCFLVSPRLGSAETIPAFFVPMVQYFSQLFPPTPLTNHTTFQNWNRPRVLTLPARFFSSFRISGPKGGQVHTQFCVVCSSRPPPPRNSWGQIVLSEEHPSKFSSVPRPPRGLVGC